MPLRVLTLNLWNVSSPWPERAKRVREWVDRLEPDLIGFQEAVRMPGLDQVPELLEGRGYHLDRVAASPFWRPGRQDVAGDVGNAVASRWPISDREELALPESGDGEKRAALSVTVDSPHGPLGFTVAHLNWKLGHGNPYARLECEPDRRIDYVFVGLPRQRDGRGQVLGCRVVCHEPSDGVWPSDHFGVYAELRTEPIEEAPPAP